MLTHFKPTKNGERWREWNVLVYDRGRKARKVGRILQACGPHGPLRAFVHFAHRVSNHVRNAADIFAEGLA